MDDAQQLQILQTFEQACLNLQQPGKEKDAEKLILEFRKLPNALSLCRILLEKSNSTSVQFHAVLAMREIILRDWTLISIEDKHSLRTYLLSYVITRTTSNTIDYVVQKQALQTVAILSKRGWFDGEVAVMAEHRGTLFQQIQQVLEVSTAATGTSILYKLKETPPTTESNHFAPIQHQQSIPVRRVGIMTLSALVDEFTYNKSNSIGLSWEYHYKCFQAFQKGELRSVFLLAWKTLCSSYLAVASSQSNDNNSGQMKDHMSLLKDALSLVLQVLNWKFDETPVEKVNVSFQHQHGESSNVIKPGASWRDVLTDGDLIEHFFLLFQFLRSIPDVSHQLLEGIQQLASVNGKIFVDEKFKSIYISRLLAGLTGLISLCVGTNVQQTMTSSLREYYITEITDIANIIQRLTTNFKLNSLLHLPDKIQQFLLEATQFTTHCLQLIIFYVSACKGSASKIDFDPEELTQLEDIVDVLLEAWVVLLGDENDSNTVNLHTYIKDFTSNIFQGYVQSRLAIANFAIDNSEVEEEDTPDDVKYDEQLTAVAYLGRLDSGNALNYLLNLLRAKASSLETFASVLGNPSALEEIHWLVLMGGHLLCDGGVGEIPRIPSSINILSKSCHTIDHDLVLSLISCIFGIITYENEFLNSNKQDSLSPLLAKTLVWFLNRWCKSYLLIDNNNYSPHILMAYGSEMHGGKGIHILDAMLRKIHINLHKWNAEFDVVKETLGLLTTLGDIKQVPAIIGTSMLPSWFELLNTFASSHPSIAQLQPVLHRTLIANLIRICDNMVSRSIDAQRGNLEDAKKKQSEYFNKIVSPVSSQLTSLLQQPNFVSIAQNYQVLSKVMILLEQLRGIARCSISDDSAIFMFCSGFFAALIRLIPVYKDCPEVLIVILQLYCDIAEFQLEFISPEQCQSFYVSTAEMLNTFVSSIGNQKLVIKSVKNSEQQKTYKDLKTIMKLLYLICYHTNASDDAQSVIFFGINLIMNFITSDLLDFPKLCKYYFELMNSLFDACPAKIATLEPRLFRNLVSSLQFGIQHHESEIARKSLEAFQSMCRFHVQNKIDAGSFGLSFQQQHDPQLIPSLLKFIMNFILFQDFNADMLDSASTTLLCLICAEYQEYTNLVQAFVGQQQNAEVKERLAGSFTMLSSNIQLNLEKKNVDSFAKNMQQFVQRVKSILLTK